MVERFVLDEKPGFDACQALFNCESVKELDDAIVKVNDFYRIYREHLLVVESNSKGLFDGVVKVELGGKL